MASDPQGSTKNLSDSRAEGRRMMFLALVSSLNPGGASNTDNLSKEDVSKLSEKLKELLGSDLPQGAMQPMPGEPLNEEGLPIIEITEPMESAPEPPPAATTGTAPIVDAEDANFIPMYRLPPAQRARNKAQMNRLLDMLEEEERLEEERNEARDRRQRREELEQRKANAKAELERLKSLKDMQKKMGKALLRNMADAREKEEQEAALRVKEDLELEETRRSRKPRKSVSWAELPKSERPSAGSDEDTWEAAPSPKLPMRPDVVERFPTRPIGASSPPPPNADSDDESNPPSPVPVDSDEGDELQPPLKDEFDIDAVQHQREIALAYFEKRNKIGADAARALSAHSHEPNDEDEWDQEAIPLDATLAGPRPKPPQSKFRSERFAQAYGTHVPSTTPSTSLGTSVLPSSSGALRRAVRAGRLEGDHLVGNGDNDSEDEGGSEVGDDARIRAFMDALRRGDVTNAGAAENSDALVAALESAYGAPPRPPPASSAPAPPTTVPTPARQQKGSKFKLARPVAPPRTLVDNEGPREGPAARVLPTSETVLERKRPGPSSPTTPRSQAPLPPTAPDVADSPMAIIDSPSFPPPPAAAAVAAPIAIINLPSFPPPRRPTRPPTVLPTSSLVR
ncbi:hypothetical protein EDB92DRAFT_2117262 [Lactarius akahatsu]|uniref:Uncharacterized protein n=1 Tax=Lactarius akahatsu TaxID=416441 RepID=A0AAD4L825_9AGAM|nr:hypothetical protein EDB92DRAFT_2117262 [Lactarius akahatsu]